ncbi:MAG: cytochrome c biogenesis protein CcsA [Actinomycetota bacterium]|nr:cytochrome c biogenesis protein CcsA [Actinomycetota bacterium]
MTVQSRQGSASWPWVAMVVAGFIALIASLLVSPDAVQEELSRILYVHVPAAWLAYVSFAVTMVASGMYLAREDLKWDRIAAASAEVGVFFTGLTLVVGMIWGKSTWGVWWTWDARLTLTAIMFFVYLGYLALRRTSTKLESRAKQSAVLGVVAIVQLPLVHFSVEWWRGLHQTASVIRPAAANMDSSMVITLFLAVAMFSIMYVAMMFKLVELANLEEQIIRRDQSGTGPVAGEAVSAPNLGTGA